MDKVNLGDLQRFLSDRPIRVNLFDRPRIVAEMVCLEPGQKETRSSYQASDELYVVIEGQAKLRTGTLSTDLEKLDSVLVAPGVQRVVENPGPDRLVMLAIVTPKPSRSGEVRMPVEGQYRPADRRPPRNFDGPPRNDAPSDSPRREFNGPPRDRDDRPFTPRTPRREFSGGQPRRDDRPFSPRPPRRDFNGPPADRPFTPRTSIPADAQEPERPAYRPRGLGPRLPDGSQPVRRSTPAGRGRPAGRPPYRPPTEGPSRDDEPSGEKRPYRSDTRPSTRPSGRPSPRGGGARPYAPKSTGPARPYTQRGTGGAKPYSPRRGAATDAGAPEGPQRAPRSGRPPTNRNGPPRGPRPAGGQRGKPGPSRNTRPKRSGK